MHYASRKSCRRLGEIHHQKRKNLKVSGEVIKRHYDLDLPEVTLRCKIRWTVAGADEREGGSIAHPRGASLVTCRICGRRRSKPRLVRGDRLWPRWTMIVRSLGSSTGGVVIPAEMEIHTPV